MNTIRSIALAGAGLVAGALLAGGIGTALAQPTAEPPAPAVDCHGPGGQAAMAAMHAQGEAALAKALGLTVEQLEAQLKAGKPVADIAKEKGVDLNALHTTMHGTMHGTAAAGAMMGGTNGMGGMMGATNGVMGGAGGMMGGTAGMGGFWGLRGG